MNIVDIIDNPDPYVIKLVEKEIEFFKENDDFTAPTRVQIYKKLNIEDFVSFTVLMDEDRFVAFSGSYTAPHFPVDSIRTGSRLWLSFDYRQRQTFHYHRHSSWNPGARMIPVHERAAKKLGYKYSFWTREYPNRRKVFLKINENCNKYSEFNQTALSGVYNTCPPIGEEKRINEELPCWQNLSLTNLSGGDAPSDFGLPSITLQEYNKRYQ